MQTSHKIKLKMAEGCQLPAVWWSAIKKFNFEICILEPEDVSLENCAIHIYKPRCKGQTITCTLIISLLSSSKLSLQKSKIFDTRNGRWHDYAWLDLMVITFGRNCTIIVLQICFFRGHDVDMMNEAYKIRSKIICVKKNLVIHKIMLYPCSI